MSVSSQPEVDITVTPQAGVEVKKFMDAEGVSSDVGGLRISVQPGGCSGFKYGLFWGGLGTGGQKQKQQTRNSPPQPSPHK